MNAYSPKQPSTIKAYSMLNSNRRRSKALNIKTLNNLPRFISFSKKYDDCTLNENKNDFQNNDRFDIQFGCVAKSSNNDQRDIISSSSYDNFGKNMSFISLHPLPSPKTSKFSHIFKEKINVCKMTFNNSQIKGKNEKLNAITEIKTLMSKRNEAKLLTTDQKNLLLEMISINILDKNPFISIENQPKSSERQWEHISLIYQILNQFVSMFPYLCKIDLVKKGIRLLNLSDDENKESENLVGFLSNYTRSHPSQFNEIWKLLKIALINVRYDIYTPYCVNPILTYFANFFIPNRISVLSKILFTHLLPLYKHEKLSIYYNKLENIIVQIVESSPEDQANAIRYLLKCFPRQCASKQPLFASTIYSIVKIADEQHLNLISTKLFNFIAMSVKSPNNKLAESALSLLMHQNMRPIIVSNYELSTSILFDSLRWSCASHWDNLIKDQCRAALLMLVNLRYDFQNSKVFFSFVNIAGQQTQQAPKKMAHEDSANKWASISQIAEKRYKSVDLKNAILKMKIDFTRGIVNKEYKKLKESLNPKI